MNWLVLLATMIILAAKGTAQEKHPSPTALSSPASGSVNALDPPLPQGEAELRAVPELLPESSILPAASNNLNPGKAAEAPISPEQKKQNEKRVAEIRLQALRNPLIVSLLREANQALTIEARRNFLRAYFISLCTRMRRIEPGLGSTIGSFQREQIRRIARSKSLSINPSGTLAE
jgi:hypothetical protein